MGFITSFEINNLFSICPQSANAYPSFSTPKPHAFYALEHRSLLGPHQTNLNKKFPIIQCNRRISGEAEHKQDTVTPIYAKEGFGALFALAFGLLCPCDALAETCPTYTQPVFNMPLLFGIALIGAAVGGLLARQRRFELERLNNQLRQINTALKRQVTIESYAPNLTYAPVGRSADTETTVDTRRDELILKLKAGKKYLRLQNPQKAFDEFKAALEIAESLGDPIEAKKAARGLGASCQRQRKYREAIKYHSMVLSISEREKEHAGDTEAYGAIADCYTELGDLVTAANFYDKYIERLETD